MSPITYEQKGHNAIHAAGGFMLLVREWGVRCMTNFPILVALGYVTCVIAQTILSDAHKIRIHSQQRTNSAA